MGHGCKLRWNIYLHLYLFIITTFYFFFYLDQSTSCVLTTHSINEYDDDDERTQVCHYGEIVMENVCLVMTIDDGDDYE